MSPRMFTLLLLAVLFVSCSEQINTAKFQPGDPFAEHLPASQHFSIAPGADTALMGEYGTAVVVLKNSFIYPDGSPVKGPVELALSEGNRLSDMLMGNITAPDGGSGAIHIEAHDARGREVRINPDAPILVEMPAVGTLHARSLMRGERGPDGSMQWKDPKPLPKYLRTVPLETLDFLPPGFAEAVDEGMPMFGHNLADEALVDSLLFYGVREHQLVKRQNGLSRTPGKFITYFITSPCWHPELSYSDSTGVAHHGDSDRYRSCPIDPA
ncbi:MAG: hypothetical protein R3B47_17455 [Bacteroidia bacterium]